MRDETEFERRLGAVLQDRVGVEARVGIERRVLAVLASDGVRARRGVGWWRAVVACGALGMVAAGMLGGGRLGLERGGGAGAGVAEGMRGAGGSGDGATLGNEAGLRSGEQEGPRVRVVWVRRGMERLRPRSRRMRTGEQEVEPGVRMEQLEIPALTLRPLGLAALAGD